MFLMLGLNDGDDDDARMSPVLASITSIKAHSGSYSLSMFFISVSANLWILESIVR